MDKYEEFRRTLRQSPFGPWVRMRELLDPDLYEGLVERYLETMKYNEMYYELKPLAVMQRKLLQPFFEKYRESQTVPREEQEKLVNACNPELMLFETGWR